ncbi:cupin family protein [Staphylotrichum tortipilum]|uniref:Cupin family protein n=1 Tax=Staphylotrichum tortipilum TaxID=2831512 RepID=A0AAN6MMA5_9PEZI|nr:cupin family protein [Staphylotrichum longicolle]
MTVTRTTPTPATAQEVIAALHLVPHPEKGYYAETFRDEATSMSTDDDSDGKARSNKTCIYYLLEGDAGPSHWHRVLDAVEVWHHYAGAPLRLSLSWDDGRSSTRHVILGSDLWSGQRPQVVVEKGEWQSARSLGAWTLVGCSVAPAFNFDGFEMAAPGWEPRGGESEPPLGRDQEAAGPSRLTR